MYLNIQRYSKRYSTTYGTTTGDWWKGILSPEGIISQTLYTVFSGDDALG